VMFPPGRARLATMPCATGSPAPVMMMMGIVFVAFLVARIACVPRVTIRSTLARTKSAASSGKPLVQSVGGSVLDDEVLPLHVTELLHAPEKAIKAGRVERLRRPLEHADSINLLRRLRVDGERRKQ